MEQKPKILYIITKGHFGGAQRYVYDLAMHLHQAGMHEVAVAVGVNGELVEQLRKRGIRTILISSLGRDISFSNDLAAFKEIFALIRAERPDIIHLNSSKVGFLGALAARLCQLLPRASRTDARIIFTAHGWAFTEDRPRVSRAVIKFLQWITVLLSHQTIAVSLHTKLEILSMPFMEKKIAVIYNGVRDIEFLPRAAARNEILQKHAIPEKALWFGTIAELHRNKGLSYALRAMAKLKEIIGTSARLIYVVIGEGEERAALQTLAGELNIQENIFLIGEYQNAARYLHAFDVFLFPSIKEGMPYALLEAGKASLPVIATKVGGIPEILLSPECGLLCEPKNSDAIADAFLRLSSNAETRKQLSTILNKKIASRHSHDVMLAATTRLY